MLLHCCKTNIQVRIQKKVSHRSPRQLQARHLYFSIFQFLFLGGVNGNSFVNVCPQKVFFLLDCRHGNKIGVNSLAAIPACDWQVISRGRSRVPWVISKTAKTSFDLVIMSIKKYFWISVEGEPLDMRLVHGGAWRFRCKKSCSKS